MSIAKRLEAFSKVKAGDEIHFTNGAVYGCFADGSDVYLLLGSFESDDFDHNWSCDRIYVNNFRAILTDAIRGGAKIVVDAKAQALKSKVSEVVEPKRPYQW